METDRYRGLEISVYAGAFVFGIVMSALGSILPALSGAIGFGKGEAGQLFLFMNFAMLAGSLLFGPVCDRFGFRALLLASTALVGAAFACLGQVASYRSLAFALALLGFGGGALNGGTNAALNDISPDRRQSALNMLGIFFGFGALFTPFFIGSLLERTGLRALLYFLAALPAVPLLLFAATRFPEAKHKGGFSRSELASVLRDPLLYLFGFLLLFQSGNEFTVGGWVSTHLAEKFQMTPRGAAYVLAAYWAALLAGRLIISRLGSRIPGPSLVMGSALLALISSTAIALTGDPVVASCCVVLVGLGFAAIFPTTLAQAGSAFAAFSGTAFSVIFVMALTGGMSAPWLAGRLAQSRGTGAGFWVTAFSCAAIAALQWGILSRVSGQEKRA